MYGPSASELDWLCNPADTSLSRSSRGLRSCALLPENRPKRKGSHRADSTQRHATLCMRHYIHDCIPYLEQDITLIPACQVGNRATAAKEILSSLIPPRCSYAQELIPRNFNYPRPGMVRGRGDSDMIGGFVYRPVAGMGTLLPWTFSRKENTPSHGRYEVNRALPYPNAPTKPPKGCCTLRSPGWIVNLCVSSQP